MRMNEIKLHTTWMDQTNILSARSQAQKSTYHSNTFTESSKRVHANHGVGNQDIDCYWVNDLNRE